MEWFALAVPVAVLFHSFFIKRDKAGDTAADRADR